jgi:hypothetical protein
MTIYDGWLNDDSLIPTPEAATSLGVSVSTMRRLARERALNAHREYGCGPLLFFRTGEIQKLKVRRANRMRRGPPLYARPRRLRKRKPAWDLPDRLRMVLDDAVKRMLEMADDAA